MCAGVNLRRPLVSRAGRRPLSDRWLCSYMHNVAKNRGVELAAAAASCVHSVDERKQLMQSPVRIRRKAVSLPTDCLPIQ